MNMFKSDMTLFESSVRPLRNISDELDAALDEPDQFSIHYQPIIESKSKKVELAEAFLRWTSPVLGEVSPGRFISVAEQNGLIRRPGRFRMVSITRSIRRSRSSSGTESAVPVGAKPKSPHSVTSKRRGRSGFKVEPRSASGERG